MWIVVEDGDKDNEVRQLIEGYVQQTEQLRFTSHCSELFFIKKGCISWLTD